MIDLFANTRWVMKPDADGFDGALIFASGIPLHALTRRDFDGYSHLERRLFDPQLYLAGLDVAKAPDTCAKLSSYGWFDCEGAAFASEEQSQSEWMTGARERVRRTWTGQVPKDRESIEDRIRACVEVQ